MNRNDAKELWQAYRDEPTTANRNKLAETYMHLARIHARKLSRKLPGVSYDDLLSEAVIGLMRAIERFQPERGFKFETYSALPIRGAIIDAVREWDWVPRKVRLQQKREPVEVPRVSSLDAESHRFSERDHALTMHDFLVDESAGDDARQVDGREDAAYILGCLGPRERRVMESLYLEGRTMKETGVELQVSESRISQMHADLLRRTRQIADRLEADRFQMTA